VAGNIAKLLMLLDSWMNPDRCCNFVTEVEPEIPRDCAGAKAVLGSGIPQEEPKMKTITSEIATLCLKPDTIVHVFENSSPEARPETH
jgi:hypothetical protein